MLVYRSTVAAAISAGALLVGCAAPELPTDLRKDGPPNVTAVTVMSDLKTAVDPSPPRLSRLLEAATHCRKDDEKRPGLVGLPDFTTTQVCPDDLGALSSSEGTAEGAPPNWFARVVFDKLLDPSVEDLVPLDPMVPAGVQVGTFVNTQPVTLRCDDTSTPPKKVDVPYNGYYVPNGNSISWPLGPALFVQPKDAVSVPTGASCELGIKDIVNNKNGESVPSDQRSYTFKIAAMELRFSSPDPADGDNGAIELTPDSPVQFYWTAAFTGTPFVDPAQIMIFEGPNLNIGTGNGDPDPAVCNGGGTAVLSTAITTSIAPPRSGASAATIATTTALIMDLAVKPNLPAPDDKLVWKPTTTYRIEFGPNAKVTPKQGGAAGTFPDGYKLCFHTTTAPAM